MGILFHTMATPERDVLAAAEFAATLGFDGIELICQADYRCGISPAIGLHEARALAAACRARNIPVVVLSAYEKRIADPDDATRSRALAALRHAIDLAAALGAGSIRILAGEGVDERGFGAALERLSRSLRELADHARARSIDLLVENHMDTMATTAARTVAICEAAGRENVGILFDPANLATLGAEGFLEGLALQRPYVRHVHVKDAVLDNGRRRSVVPGDGSDPWPEAIASLKQGGYGGHFSIEYERRWLADLPDAALALPRAREFLQRCLDRAEGR